MKTLLLFLAILLGLLVAVLHLCGAPVGIQGNLGLAAGLLLLGSLSVPEDD